MNCYHASALLDDFADGRLGPVEYEALARHLQDCPECRQALEHTHRLVASLRRMPVPAPSADFAERVLRQAAGAGAPEPRRARHRGFAAGFAAALALWAVIGLWQGPLTGPGAEVGTVALAAHQVRPVSLAFNAPSEIRSVTFSLELPRGVQLQGHPGKRRIVWHGHLNKGRNVLRLQLVARDMAAGDLIARIAHRGQSKQFRVHLQVRAPQGSRAGPART